MADSSSPHRDCERPDRERDRSRRVALTRKWRRAVAQYRAAEAPFGPSPRGVEIWIEYGRQTTAN